MEYFFIILFQIFGILTHAVQKIITFDKQNPDKDIKQIGGLFFENEWSSLIASIVFLLIHVGVHGVIDYYDLFASITSVPIPWTQIEVPMPIASILLAFTIGYLGQRVVYKYLGKYEEYLVKKADNIQ